MAYNAIPQRPFGALLTAMATPFDDDGTLSLPLTKAVAQHLIAAGHDGIVVNGTTGEAPTTSDGE
ncbi:MAG: dihydrodipicolinate synthase family protein, partial [Bifidobacteriaceae bacterium]|nr:dihydrodipicolinate synthase family protein [Bifidobacteriaceae bacterium]